MLKYFKPYIVFIALFTISCEDFFDTTINIDPPKHESKLALYGEAFVGQDTMELSLTQSFGILDTISTKPITGAKITCTHNGIKVAYLERKTIINTVVTLQFSKPLAANDIVDIKVEYPGFPTLTAKTTVPSSPTISNVTYLEDGGNDEFGDNISLVTLEYKGNNAAVDFFKIDRTEIYKYCVEYDQNECIKYDTIRITYQMNIKDPAAIHGFLMKHDNTKLKKYRATTYRNSVDSISIDVTNMTESAFDYENSRKNYENSKDNPFSTPVNIRSNIINGYGRFYVYNVTKFKF